MKYFYDDDGKGQVQSHSVHLRGMREKDYECAEIEIDGYGSDKREAHQRARNATLEMIKQLGVFLWKLEDDIHRMDNNAERLGMTRLAPRVYVVYRPEGLRFAMDDLIGGDASGYVLDKTPEAFPCLVLFEQQYRTSGDELTCHLVSLLELLPPTMLRDVSQPE